MKSSTRATRLSLAHTACTDAPCTRVNQSSAYPMQLMLGLYERPAERRADAPGDGDFPKQFVVDYVRGYRRDAAPASRA